MSEMDKVKALAEAENHLWEITGKHKFSEIPAANNVISGHDFVTKKLDLVFPDKYPVTDFSFIKGADGKADPEVDAFVKAHPDKVAGLLEYANQYGVIEEKKVGVNKDVADKVIVTVDNLYPKPDYYVDGKFDVAKIVAESTDMNVTDGKGFAHQLKHQFSLDDKQAFRLAEQI